MEKEDYEYEEEKSVLNAFPSIEDDVEFSTDKFSEKQLERFAFVRDQITALGSAGLTKELAKGQAAQLCEAVKNVDMSESTGLSEEQCGRKLHKNVQSCFQFVLGSVMRAIVETNFPIDRYIADRNEAVAKLEAYLEVIAEDGVVVHKPELEYYNLRKQIEWAEKVKKRSKARTTRAAAKSAPKVSSAGVSEEQEESAPLSDVEEDREVFEHGINKEYMEEYEKWKLYDLATQRRASAKRRADSTLGKFLMLVTLLEGIRSAIGAIASKIKKATKDHEKVKQKLGCMVSLKATGESISNPLENGNLSGLCEILKIEYAEATLVRFNSDLQQTMKISISLEDMGKNPMKAVQRCDDMLATWQTMDYWTYMTQDIFFTNILLSAMPTSAFQRECVTEVQKFLEAKDNASGDLRDDGTVMTTTVVRDFPVYNFLRRYIKRYENSSNHGKQPAGGGGGGGGANPRYRINPFPGRSGNVETAALSGVEYSTEMGRDKQLMCKDVGTGQEHPYTATRELCAKCYGRGINPTDKHQPRCFHGICNRCGLYGHKQFNCAQSQSTYVGKQQQSQKSGSV
jgi:hypothetical protein